jgi:hypothetical protein
MMKEKSTLAFMLTTLATLVIVAAVMLTAGPAYAATRPAMEVVKLKVGAPTEVGGQTLEPGNYKVNIIPDSSDASDPTVQFSEVVEDDYVAEGLSPYAEQVLLTVQSSVRDLGAPAARTELIPSSADNSNMANSLQIRGRSTEYVFSANAASAASGQ